MNNQVVNINPEVIEPVVNNKRVKKAIGFEGFIALFLFLGFFTYLGSVMGTANMLQTMMNTAFDLLINTVFYIMAISVLAGAVAAILTEFGIVALINKCLSLLMKPLYNLPGAAALGMVTTYLSDNPAILTLASDKGFKKYFKKFQLPALTNMGTAFGMGLVVTTTMAIKVSSTGESMATAALVGNIGAVVGSIVSVRIMMIFTKKRFGTEEMAVESNGDDLDVMKFREVREGSVSSRLLEAMLDGGKAGVELGMGIIPGVLIICTVVMMLTYGVPDGGYTGAAFEGVRLLPAIGEIGIFKTIFGWLFGFTSGEALAFPITALGAVGAALGLVDPLLKSGTIGGNEIAVFTAMGMCWSGYLSTHVAMMDGLGCRDLTGKAILSHTVGGLCAGISAHWIYVLITSLF
ncbi:hypothetical protein [Oceanirhabdus seepicola]|uniref:Nucleoside transporter/FeoB GTPase Gate domain-containing protein n=1 Tax=Oceanirhabdus seepicola TaxID=2828781 RepID=A0A9J6P7C0_9CLOT|nr:hypothetical protein [Oceanirhabdus seepicola]MCM1992515.1 hypothetical protein [Oceanirhabdus seepicola]